MANEGRPAGGVAGLIPAARVVVALSPAGSGKADRVESPGRLLRLWALLNAAGEELHPQDLSPATRAWLQRQLTAVTEELSRCVSADLVAELHGLWRPSEGIPDAPELRIEYALVLGWLSGLVIGMLEQIEASARSSRHAAVVPVAQPGGGPSGAGQPTRAGQPDGDSRPADSRMLNGVLYAPPVMGGWPAVP